MQGGKCWRTSSNGSNFSNNWPPSYVASLARPSPPLRLYTGSDTSSMEIGGLASQTMVTTPLTAQYSKMYVQALSTIVFSVMYS